MHQPTTQISDEEAIRRFIAHHYRAAFTILGKARGRRQWLRKLPDYNPGAGRFYGEHLDLLSNELRMHRRYIRQGRAELAALKFGEAA